MDEAHRRWYVGWLATQPTSPSERALSRITGLDPKTIRRGRRELVQELVQELVPTPVGRQRRAGGGRPLAEKKTRR